MTPDQAQATEALAALRTARLKAAAMPRMGWGYHLVFGAMMAGLIVQHGMPIGAGRAAVLLAVIVLGVILYRWKRSATGRWINGYRSGRTRLVAFGLLVLIVGLMVLSPPMHAVLETWQAALLAGVVATLGGRLWYAAYDADLRA